MTHSRAPDDENDSGAQRRSGGARRTISIATLTAVLGLIGGIAGGTANALTKMDEIAQKAVAPVQAQLAQHLVDVKAALGPGGAMHDFKVRSEERDAYLVDAVAALCAATPKAPCPPPGRLVSKQ